MSTRCCIINKPTRNTYSIKLGEKKTANPKKIVLVISTITENEISALNRDIIAEYLLYSLPAGRAVSLLLHG